jgi:hypothetical protein
MRYIASICKFCGEVFYRRERCHHSCSHNGRPEWFDYYGYIDRNGESNGIVAGCERHGHRFQLPEQRLRQLQSGE